MFEIIEEKILVTKTPETKQENQKPLTLTIGELAAGIGGKIFSHPEKSGEAVENYMVGALTPDSGLDYFNRKKNKAVIIRKERLDMQLAALETPTKCLVLSGEDITPAYRVRQKADSRVIPIIITEAAVDVIIARIDNLIANKYN